MISSCLNKWLHKKYTQWGRALPPYWKLVPPSIFRTKVNATTTTNVWEMHKNSKIPRNLVHYFLNSLIHAWNRDSVDLAKYISQTLGNVFFSVPTFIYDNSKFPPAIFLFLPAKLINGHKCTSVIWTQPKLKK